MFFEAKCYLIVLLKCHLRGVAKVFYENCA